MPERLEHEMDACGAAYVILTLDLGTFVTPASRETLLDLRGRKEFDDFLEKFDPHDSRFERDAYYTAVERRGYELGVFNRILAEDNFAPTYRLVKEQVKFPPELESNVQFRDKFLQVWQRWSFWFRLSSNGIVTIILKLDLSKPRELVHISRDVMGLQGYFDMDSARQKLAELRAAPPTTNNLARIASIEQFMAWTAQHAMTDIEREHPAVVWQMAVEVMYQFMDACGGLLRNNSAAHPFDLEFRPEPEQNGAGSLRNQYTIFYFREVGQYDWSAKRRQVILPNQLICAPYARVVSSLLEGIIIKGKTVSYYPTHDDDHVREIIGKDQSSWENELCVLTDRSALIYAYLPKEKWQIVFSSRPMPYTDYWETILRGIEFNVETQLLVQLVEQITASYLSEALPLLRGNRELGPSHLQAFDACAGNAARLIAHLRTITAPHLIAQASYAVRKFDFLGKQTGILGILTHAEANLTDLTALLESKHELSLQVESQRMNEVALAISILFAGVTFSLGILALPSFMADWEQERIGYLSRLWYYPYLSYVGEFIVASAAVAGALSLVWAFATFIRVRGRRKPRLFW